MTRDEAVEKLKAIKIADDYTHTEKISSHGLVDGLVALGLLNLEDAKSPEEELREAVEGAPLSLVSWAELSVLLDDHKLTVVRAEADAA